LAAYNALARHQRGWKTFPRTQSWVRLFPASKLGQFKLRSYRRQLRRVREPVKKDELKTLTTEKIKQVVHMTLRESSSNAIRWSLRGIAATVGIS
jgi:hypothetical protein